MDVRSDDVLSDRRADRYSQQPTGAERHRNPKRFSADCGRVIRFEDNVSVTRKAAIVGIHVDAAEDCVTGIGTSTAQRTAHPAQRQRCGSRNCGGVDGRGRVRLQRDVARRGGDPGQVLDEAGDVDLHLVVGDPDADSDRSKAA